VVKEKSRRGLFGAPYAPQATMLRLTTLAIVISVGKIDTRLNFGYNCGYLTPEWQNRSYPGQALMAAPSGRFYIQAGTAGICALIL
jgi:hypothetical protein